MEAAEKKEVREAAEARVQPQVRREITAEEARKLASEERERRANLSPEELAEGARQGLPPPILEGDGFDPTTSVLEDFTGMGGELEPGEVEEGKPLTPAQNLAQLRERAIPKGDFPMPAGWVVFILRFRASTTNTPKKGDRTCVLWNLSDTDEKLAARRANGVGIRLIDEMAKGMIRAFDGKKADNFQDIGKFWTEIGGKNRTQIKTIYLRNHTMSPEENTDFFEHCIVSLTAG